MEVRKDFGKRVAELSSSTPRQAVANLLTALLPRVPIAVRAPSPAAMPGSGTPEGRAPIQGGGFLPNPMRKLSRKRPRTRKAGQYIIPLVRPERSGIRYGCGRYAKLELVWDMYDEHDGALPLHRVLGRAATDNRGKLHEIDMGAINGMLERGHIRLEGE